MTSYRAPGPEPGHDRPTGGPAAVRKAVEGAADAVLDTPSGWRWHALNEEEARRVMGRLVDVITDEAPFDEAAAEGCGNVVALTLRMSDLLRQELLQDPRGLSDRALVDVTRRIEQCRVKLEPRTHQDLTYLLTGANALDLVVEFAHDLRSPLTSIMFLAETLRKGQSGEINDIQRDQLGIMYSAALGMVSVANDLMDLASSEADDAWGAGMTESFSIQELVESTRKIVAPMAEQKRLDITFYTPRHDVRKGQPSLLSRVLLNLATNALKFTEKGGVEILIEEGRGDRVTVSVNDTGRGMSPESVESLRHLFGRSQSRTGFHFSGTGLGLAICDRMVDKMGGELQVESTEGEGTRFHFEIELPKA